MIPVDQAWDNFNKNIVPDMKCDLYLNKDKNCLFKSLY